MGGLLCRGGLLLHRGLTKHPSHFPSADISLNTSRHLCELRRESALCLSIFLLLPFQVLNLFLSFISLENLKLIPFLEGDLIFPEALDKLLQGVVLVQSYQSGTLGLHIASLRIAQLSIELNILAILQLDCCFGLMCLLRLAKVAHILSHLLIGR